ncbi:MAG TPA: cation:proton antiporter [Peptococcaceae bacterium]|nr:cation:proton antiporter [Peptococcaceae bacterium]
MGYLWLEPVFLILLILSAAVALGAKDLLVSVIMFSVFSFAAAVLYTLMMAADVAFVEVVIGGVTTIFYISVLYRTRRRVSS